MRNRTYKYTLCGIGVVIALIVVAVTAYSVMNNRIRALHRLESNIAEMARIDEILTSSALLATATGDMIYHERYYAYVHVLDELIRQSVDMFDSDQAEDRLSKTQKANEWLVATEERALMAMQAGANPATYTLLRSDEYVRHKKDYASGLKEAMSVLEAHATSRVQRVRAFIIAMALAVLLAAVAILRLAYTTRIERRALRLHRQQADVMRGLLGTFMDVQNNLLNNMVYFRTKAACNLPFDEDDVRMIDEEIDRAKTKLADLVDTGIGKTRDLGGIVVIEMNTAEERKVA